MQKSATVLILKVSLEKNARVSALGTKNKTTPFSAARVDTSTSSSFSFLRVRWGKESPAFILSSFGRDSVSSPASSVLACHKNLNKCASNCEEIIQMRTFLLVFAPSSSALLLALGFGAALGFGSAAGCEVTLEERLGAGCSLFASATGAFRGGIFFMLSWNDGKTKQKYVTSKAALINRRPKNMNSIASTSIDLYD